MAYDKIGTGLDEKIMDWTLHGLIKHELTKHGLIKHESIKYGLIKHNIMLQSR